METCILISCSGKVRAGVLKELREKMSAFGCGSTEIRKAPDLDPDNSGNGKQPPLHFRQQSGQREEGELQACLTHIGKRNT